MSHHISGRRRLAALVAAGSLVLAGAVVPLTAVAGPVSDVAGFEGDDGNLAVDDTGAPKTDWNSFDPLTWTGTAPYQEARKENGWKFFGLTDATATNSDTAFAGGVKQDDWCATTKGGKAPNKDDLVRTYLASQTVGNDVFLSLAWVRIPQNSTTASAHVAFEFNQNSLEGAGAVPCPDNPDLVQREPGDALIVYDFQGGDAAPTLKLSRWLETAPEGTDPADWEWDDYTCEISGDLPAGQDADGCWGNTQELTTPGFAEARVNTASVGTVDDELAPGGTETLGLVEFGEAIINLTDAGVFSPDQCLALGSVFAVSRSSGNSAQAQMKDLVGPGELDLRNCGKITVVKQTDPADSSASFPFAVSPASGLENASDASFSLTDASGTPPSPSKVINNVQPGTYTVSETVPSGWQFTSVSCTGATATPGTASVSFAVVAESDVVCTFNNQQKASIIVEKVLAGTTTRIDGATFALDDDGDPGTTDDQTNIPSVTGTGLYCIDNLTPGSYNVVETAPPSGYAGASPQVQTGVSAVVGSCTDRSGATPDVTFANKKITSLATTPYLYPNDDAALSGGTSPTGTITFNLLAAPGDGEEACEGAVLFTQDVTVDNGNDTYSTTNYPGVQGVTPYKITEDGLYYWEVIYDGDSSNTGATSTCTAEFFDVDVTPDPESE